MREIPLTRGKVAVVDDEDFEELARSQWFAVKSPGDLWYAARCARAHESGTAVKMHRYILAAPPDMYVDHRDGDGLNNRRSNIRLCFQGQNQANRFKWQGTTSVYKGVSRRRDSQRWWAKLCVNGKHIRLGSFPDEIEAARAYNAAAQLYFGEFARLNQFPNGTTANHDAADSHGILTESAVARK